MTVQKADRMLQSLVRGQPHTQAMYCQELVARVAPKRINVHAQERHFLPWPSPLVESMMMPVP
jgi:hypothetical protein